MRHYLGVQGPLHFFKSCLTVGIVGRRTNFWWYHNEEAKSQGNINLSPTNSSHGFGAKFSVPSKLFSYMNNCTSYGSYTSYVLNVL